MENKKWEIELYEQSNGKVPVLEFILSLPKKMQAKVTRTIDLLEEFGISLAYPHVDSIKGEEYKGMWELRTKLSSNITRIFYFLHDGNKFVLLHGYAKKDAKTDQKQLKKAKFRMDEYKQRKDDVS
ncbi:type II toxin-antitoxin system RelE/ParE family toxin [Inediibacterium massiliense]|uniref:type II toxin-antitoxin system RelE/ParE family toxin n=1 Tax=Inediibacterium massiliense TaxID=1658111 RepID=UPI0006B4E807|nr:type II toxin-antitoxin system RelE/ParE family toxin [Inediibacterium massiliense]